MNLVALRIAYAAYFANIPHDYEVLLKIHETLVAAVDEDTEWEEIDFITPIFPWYEFEHCGADYLLDAVDKLYNNIVRHLEVK